MRGTPSAYYSALNRPQLIFGVERRLFFVLLALSSVLVLTSLFRPLMLLISSVLFCIGISVGRFLTRSDAAFLVIYQHHLRYQAYYEPLPHLLSPVTPPVKSVPLFKRGRR